MKIGDTYQHTFSFTQEDVDAFAKVTGDNNPVHTDEAYAANTIFKKPVMHGMLGACVFSRVFGTLFPGEGSIYLKQELKFLKPMYTGEEFVAKFEVTDLNERRGIATISSIIENIATSVKCTDGIATVMIPKV